MYIVQSYHNTLQSTVFEILYLLDYFVWLLVFRQGIVYERMIFISLPRLLIPDPPLEGKMIMLMMMMMYARYVESVSWCLAASHLSKALLCIIHRSSVTVGSVSSNSTFTLLHTLSTVTIPQGSLLHSCTFLLCDALVHSAVLRLLSSVRPSVCLSVRLWRSGTVMT